MALISGVSMSSERRLSRLLPALGLALLLTACAGKKSGNEDYIETPPEILYNQGIAYLQQNDYTGAAKKFAQLDREHPYSALAQKALLMTAFSSFSSGTWDDAITGGQRYIALYPGADDADYAQYLVAMSYFNQMPDVNRDQTVTLKALDAFNELIAKYPNSHYAEEGKRRVEILRDQLAGKEMTTGRYYLDRRDYIAAINRFKVVITNYQTTRHTEEALERLTEAYYAIGVVSEAQTAAAVLGHNFPDSRWYRDAYRLLKSNGLEPREDNTSFISKAFNFLTN